MTLRVGAKGRPEAEGVGGDLAGLIKANAADVRARDFLWSAGVTAGILAVVLLSGWASRPWLAVGAWAAFIAALLVRYRFSSGREWSAPIERAVESEMAAQAAELRSLRLARGVADALPEPLFILDRSGVVELANPAATEFVEAKSVEGRHIASVLRAPAVFEAVESIAAGERAYGVDFSTLGAVERHCRAYVAPLDGGAGAGGDGRRVLVYIRDLTGERRIEQMRADFIASASHELRTPLASLLGFIETLRGHAKGDPEAQDRFLAIMQTQAERMQRLVADLMSLSRIEINEHVPPRGRLELCGAVKDVVESIRPLLDQSEAIVDYDCPCGEEVQVVGDRDEIMQAVQNLVDNAAKYGGDPAMIKLRVGVGAAPPLSADGEMTHRVGDTAAQLAARQNTTVDRLAYVQVRDFGPGIERGDLPRLTERFYRVNVERSKKIGGTGLGLAIVKHIVNRHKGGFQVESRLAGGTAFTLYFHRAD